MLLIGTLIVLALWLTFVCLVDPDGLQRQKRSTDGVPTAVTGAAATEWSRGKGPACALARSKGLRAFGVRPSAAMNLHVTLDENEYLSGLARAAPIPGRRFYGTAI